jgi:hypothetical protein
VTFLSQPSKCWDYRHVLLCLECNFQYFEEILHCFPSRSHHYTFLPAVKKRFTFSTSLPTLAIFCFFFNLTVLGLKLRVSRLLGKFSTTWTMPPILLD